MSPNPSRPAAHGRIPRCLSPHLRTALLLPLACSPMLAPAAARAQGGRQPATLQRQPFHIGEITITDFRDLLWQPENSYFKSPGPVRILIEDADTHRTVTLIADDAEGQPGGDILVRGHLTLERPEGTITGRAGTYHASNQTGELLDAEAQANGIVLRGAKVEVLRDSKGRQYLRATGGYFTTCDKPKPDYHITAREIRVSANRQVTAKNVGFYIGNFRLLTLPTLSKNFSRTVDTPIPLPAYSRENFIQLHARNDLVERPATLASYDIIISLRRTPSGTLSYEHDLGHTSDNTPPPDSRRYTATEPLRSALETTPALLRGSTPPSDIKRTTFYSLVTASTFVYNRRRTDLRVSRLPEIGVTFRNILNRPTFANTSGPQYPRMESAFGRGFLSPSRWFVNAEANLGYFTEAPTHAHASRIGMRADATSPLFTIEGPLYVRYGGSLWVNAYGNGNGYALLAPEAELDYLLRPNTLVGAAYRYMQDFGTTPFLFDRRDVTHEMRLRYSFLGAHWAYDAEVRLDLERLHAYDNVFSIRRRLDCLEFGLAYHTRNQGISLIFNLLPSSGAASHTPANMGQPGAR